MHADPQSTLHQHSPLPHRLRLRYSARQLRALLNACRGDESETPFGPPAATAQDLTPTALDGALQNVTIFLDKNANGAGNADQPSAKATADGSTTLKVASANVGKFRLTTLVKAQMR